MKMIKEYVEKYYTAIKNRDMSYTELATKILEDIPNMGLTHRTVRYKVSEEFKTLDNKPGINASQFEVNLDKPLNSSGFALDMGYVEQGCGWIPGINVPDGPRPIDWTVKGHYADFSIKPTKVKMHVISDLHGIYLDFFCFNTYLNVIKEDEPDIIIINGDAIDLPFLSRHSQKLIKAGVLTNYTEVIEVEFVKKHILKPLRAAAPNAQIIFRLGNHDERITNPYELTQAQMKRLALLYHHYQTTKFEEMLELDKFNMEYDPTPVRNYYGIFDVMHGLSLAKNAQEANINNRYSSGTTGHSHRLGIKYITKAGKHFAWVESGHMRKMDEVEYLPTAILPDWTQGFVEVMFDLVDKPKFFARPIAIIEGVCEYNGKFYRG